jgi:hypothetical protein
MKVMMSRSSHEDFLCEHEAVQPANECRRMSVARFGHHAPELRTSILLCEFKRLLQDRALLAIVVLAAASIISGCSGLVSASGTNPPPNGAIQVTPGSLNFGNAVVGQRLSLTASVANTGNTLVSVSSAAVSSGQFSITGLAMPMSLPVGQSSAFQVWFDPTAPGNATGTLTVQTSTGVSGAVTLTGSATASPQRISLSTTNLNLGSVATGSTTSGPVTISNTGGANLVVSFISVSGSSFGVTGITTPNTIAPGGNASFNVSFTPSTAGSATGSITITSNDPQSPATIVNLSGTGTSTAVAPTITTQPASQTVTAGQTARFIVTAGGTAPLSYQWLKNGVNIAGANAASYTTPITATSDSGSTFDVVVSNTAGTVTSAAATLTVNTGTVAPTITTQPASQTVTAGQTATFIVAAGGTAPLSYQWQKNGVSIAGATAASYTTLAMATSDSGSTFDVVVSNTAGTVTSAAATLTVNAAPAPKIQVSSTSVNFGNAVVGSNLSQALIITNTGTATLSITQVTPTGSAFSVSGFAPPLSVSPGQQTTITAAFTPTSVGAASGSISILSNAPTSPTSVALSGTGIAATLTLSINPTNLNFGNITTGTSSTSQNVTITNTGNANVTISQITVSGAGFGVTGGSSPVTLTPLQNLTLAAQFSPAVAGSVNGSISITSNATGSPAAVTLSGTGIALVQHSVALTWNASTSVVTGYNVYRTTTSGTGYAKVNSSLVGVLNYSDSTVQSATTYFYVTTAVDASGNESGFSNEVSAPIP